jgi:hypothetical protein
MSKVNLAIPLAALLAACNPSDKGGDSGNTTGTFVPPPTDTSGDTAPAPVVPVQVAAIGFEFQGGWNQETGQLEDYLYPDLSNTNGGSPLALLPVVHVTLANTAFFQSGGPNDPNNYCDFFATFDATPATFTGTTFDWDTGKGGLGDSLETWGAFEGKLTILTDTYSPSCFGLDEAMWPGQTPTETMDGMHFGLGFGPESEYLYQQDYDYYGSAPPYASAVFTQYIAVNHPDGSGGFTFPAYDWDSSLYVQADYSQCLQYTYTTDTANPLQVCGLVLLNDDQSQYLLGDTTVQPIHGYVTGNAYWYEDIPNLDLTILKDGVP